MQPTSFYFLLTPDTPFQTASLLILGRLIPQQGKEHVLQAPLTHYIQVTVADGYVHLR